VHPLASTANPLGQEVEVRLQAAAALEAQAQAHFLHPVVASTTYPLEHCKVQPVISGQGLQSQVGHPASVFLKP